MQRRRALTIICRARRVIDDLRGCNERQVGLIEDLARTNRLLIRDLADERVAHGATARQLQLVQAERRQLAAHSQLNAGDDPWVDAQLDSKLIGDVTDHLTKRFSEEPRVATT